jgi:uncharacterized protein (TIGR03032 family)
VHSQNFPGLLEQLGGSLLITTYQAGKLIIARNDGGQLNTHFRFYPKPMGMALTPTHLAIGTAREVWYHRNMPDVGRKLEPPGKHDACYLPRNIHVTGDIDIHEMGWGTDGLWAVNTRFSCLCRIDEENSFVPVWRPPFVSFLAPEDRCHLNGLALVDGQPRYVTALGTTDSPQGWRENKANGGMLMDIDSEQMLLQGLSMPHSPRWYRDRLWVLESGDGGLGYLDPDTGKLVTVAQLPGFTRGLDFVGPLAFVGLSQIRETAVFSNLPITERLEERICGVWVVNIETGETVALLRFEQAVQEIFAVQFTPWRFPEVLEWDDPAMAHSYMLPDEALKDVAKIG